MEILLSYNLTILGFFFLLPVVITISTWTGLVLYEAVFKFFSTFKINLSDPQQVVLDIMVTCFSITVSLCLFGSVMFTFIDFCAYVLGVKS